MRTNLTLGNRALLAVISGLSFWPLTSLEEVFELSPLSFGGYVVTGGIFGLLVLVPLINARGRRYWRAIGLVLGSIAVYALVASLAVSRYGLLDLDENVGVIVSGVLGAVLVGVLTKFAAPLNTTGKFWLCLLGAGLLGGSVFSLLLWAEYGFVVAVGYVAWQLSIFIALSWKTSNIEAVPTIGNELHT